MPKRDYITTGDDVVEYADLVADYLETHGWRVRVEFSEVGFPFTPTLTATRQQTTMIVEVDTSLRADRTEQWLRYAKSCSRDTRVGVCLAPAEPLSVKEFGWLRDRGIAVYEVSAGKVQQLSPPTDQAMSVELPALDGMHRKLRERLAPAYEQFEGGDWREGFRTACEAFEQLARDRLKQGMRSRRVILTRSNGNPWRLTVSGVDKLTMGQLADVYGAIQTQTHADAVTHKVLKAVNPERVLATHHRGRAMTEKRLRQNVGQHMWKVYAAMKELLGVE